MLLKRILALTLSLSILISTIGTVGTTTAFAATKVLQIAQARNMAIASSPEISKQQNELILTQMKYTEAVEGIAAKIKSKETFRWSPFLSFKWPQPLTMVDQYELTIKPVVLQSEITVSRHKLRDLQYEMLGKASNQYVKVYTLQEKLVFAESKMELAKNQLSRNKARLLTGQANQEDVDSMTKSEEKLKEELTNLGREIEAAKKELKDIIKLDITSGYKFVNPMQVLNLPRKELQAVTDFTLANDQGYYEAQTAVSVALMNLNAYESILNKKFYNDMRLIRPFITSVRQGKDVDFAAFKIAYKQMLKNMDQPWVGMWGWWFFSFPQEWFKGDIDGTRYIEDEMYAPYTACMEYSNAVKAEQTARKALVKQVEGDYNTLVSTYNSYLSFEKTAKSAKERLQRTSELNRLGRAEYSELQEALEGYQSAQIDTMDALTSYNEMLHNYDRLTCGAITKYLSGAKMEADAGVGGDSMVLNDDENKPYYYIYTSTSDWAFQVGISIPKNFQPNITQYELWLGNQQIGTRTTIDKSIRHLSLDYAGDPILTIKLFNNNVYIAESNIDAQVPHGVLDLVGKIVPPETTKTIGSYLVAAKQTGDVKTSTLTLKIDAAVGAKSYNLTYPDNGSVYTGEHLAIDIPFTYLTLLIPSLGTIELELYDADNQLINKASFNTVAGTITVPVGEVGGAT